MRASEGFNKHKVRGNGGSKQLSEFQPFVVKIRLGCSLGHLILWRTPVGLWILQRSPYLGLHISCQSDTHFVCFRQGSHYAVWAGLEFTL